MAHVKLITENIYHTFGNTSQNYSKKGEEKDKVAKQLASKKKQSEAESVISVVLLELKSGVT